MSTLRLPVDLHSRHGAFKTYHKTTLDVILFLNIFFSPKGNNWGICPDGSGQVGCGNQEQFRGCADVAVDRHVGEMEVQEQQLVVTQ